MRDLQDNFTKEVEAAQKATSEEEKKNAITADDDKLAELFKIEDQIAQTHGIETEHFILMKDEFKKQDDEKLKEFVPLKDDSLS